ncbi:MAG TPA: ATP-dependent Clp protease proteolytic subunit [Blastocatellia bacterium]|nr:ATP-dependent Clp protease proteolytic subunit [Blastocatellia bacterium]
MDDQQKALLNEYGVLVLPEELEHDAFALVLMACLMRPDKEIRLHCRGNGGSCRAGMAIVDLVREHGQFIGLLTSEANSTHGVIFAGCPRRYVYPSGSLGAHRIALSEMYHIDAPYARNRYEEMETGDRYNAKILASACKDQKRWGEKFWYRQLNQQGSRGLKQFDAKFLIECGMAEPITALRS